MSLASDKQRLTELEDAILTAHDQALVDAEATDDSRYDWSKVEGFESADDCIADMTAKVAERDKLRDSLKKAEKLHQALAENAPDEPEMGDSHDFGQQFVDMEGFGRKNLSLDLAIMKDISTIARQPFQRGGIVTAPHPMPTTYDIVRKVFPANDKVDIYRENKIDNVAAATAQGTTLPKANFQVVPSVGQLQRVGLYTTFSRQQYRYDAPGVAFLVNRTVGDLAKKLSKDMSDLMWSSAPTDNRTASTAAADGVNRQEAISAGIARAAEFGEDDVTALIMNHRTYQACRYLTTGVNGGLVFGGDPEGSVGQVPVAIDNQIAVSNITGGAMSHVVMYLAPDITLEITDAFQEKVAQATSTPVPAIEGTGNLTGEIAIIAETYALNNIERLESLVRVDISTTPNTAKGGSAGYYV